MTYSENLMLSWQLHGTTRETPHTNIFNMAAIVIDDSSSDSGFFNSKLYHYIFGIIYHLYTLHWGDSTNYYPKS